MNTKNSSVTRFGVVLWFNEQKNIGQMRVGGETQEVEFTLDSQRVVVDGPKCPQFSQDKPARSPLPQAGSHVVVAIRTGYHHTQPPGHDRLDRFVEAAGWNFAFEWQDAAKRIAARPVYEVTEFTLLKGEPVSGQPPRVVVSGTVEEIQAKFPRGAAEDPLAPEKKVLDLLYRRAFFLLQGGKKVRCSDPRPLPKTVVAMSTPALAATDSPKLVNGNGDDLASEDEILALAASVNGRRAGTSTPHPEMAKA